MTRIARIKAGELILGFVIDWGGGSFLRCWWFDFLWREYVFGETV